MPRAMKDTRKLHGIGVDTGIMPDMVAEAVVENAFRLVEETASERDLGFYAGRLVEMAEVQYATSPSFRRKVQGDGNSGRDYLYAFMQHWISSHLLQVSGNRPDWRRALVDSGFSTGKEL